MAASLSRSIWSRVAGVASLAATPLTPSHYLEMVSPLRATHTRNARVEGVRTEAPGAKTITLRPGRGWRGHRPGQFVRVGAEIDGRIVTRTYSISSSPERADGCVEITVKAVPGGKMSAHITQVLRPGQYVTLEAAEGDFVLPEATALRPLFLTGGSGITPVMSMVRSLAVRGAMPDAAHVHYAPRADEAIFGAELRAIAQEHPGYRFVLVATRAGDAAQGRFDGTQIDALVPDWRTRDAWACGPQTLLDAIEGVFASEGRSERLHLERFRPKLAPLDPTSEGGRVRFGRSRAEVDASAQQSLLEAAEKAGVNPRHGCRMGICHSCDVSLVSGCVRDLRTGRRIDEPGARVQLCVCAAAGDVELAV